MGEQAVVSYLVADLIADLVSELVWDLVSDLVPDLVPDLESDLVPDLESDLPVNQQIRQNNLTIHGHISWPLQKHINVNWHLQKSFKEIIVVLAGLMIDDFISKYIKTLRAA